MDGVWIKRAEPTDAWAYIISIKVYERLLHTIDEVSGDRWAPIGRDAAWEIIQVMPSLSPPLFIPLSALHTEQQWMYIWLTVGRGTNRGSNLQTATTQKPHVDRNIKNCSIFDEKIATCCIHVSIVLRTQKAIDSFTKPSHPVSLYTTTPWLRRMISVQCPSTKNIIFLGQTSFSRSVFYSESHCSFLFNFFFLFFSI